MNGRKKTVMWTGLLVLAMALGLMSGILPGMGVTACAADTEPTIGDTVKIERVDKEWYVIGKSDETVTLLAKENFKDYLEFNINHADASPDYNKSTIKQYVEGLLEPGQPLARIKNALANINLGDVSGAVPYLLSDAEANNLGVEMRKCNADWWLRTKSMNGPIYVKSDGQIYLQGESVFGTRGVRPALQLKKEAVKYSPDTKTFLLLMGHEHHFSYTAEGNSIIARCESGCPVSYDTNPARLTIKAEDATYNGSAYTGAAIEATDWTATGLALPAIEYTGRGDTSYAKSTTAPKDAGTYTASITVNTDVTVKADFTISRKEIFINGATAEDREFEKGNRTVKISSVTFQDEHNYPVMLTMGENADYTATGEINTDTAGDNKLVQVGVTLKNMSYKLEIAGWPATVNISKKAEPHIDDVQVEQLYTQTAVSQSLAGKMPEDAGSLAYEKGSVKKSGNVSVKTFYVNTDGTVIAELSGGEAGNTVTLPVTIHSDNYIDADVNVIVKLMDDAGVSITNVPKTYGDPDFVLTGSVARPGEGTGTWTWTSSDSSVLQVTGNGQTATVKILKAGTATITARYRTNTSIGTWTTGLITVNKKPIVVRALNQEAYVGDAVPGLSAPVLGTHYTVSGLVGEDTLTTAPTLVYQKNGKTATPDNTAAGTYDIVPSGASAGDNYDISYINGTLTISGKQTATVTEAPTAKTGLTYTGSAQELVNAGTADGGTMKYALGDSSKSAPVSGYTTSIPTATAAGTYYVWYKVVGDKNHLDTDPKVITTEIGKAKITKVKLARSILKYTGEELTAKVEEVKAGDLPVPAEAYTISGNRGIDEGKYTVTVTAVEHSNYTGSATADFHIVKPGYKYMEISLSEDTFVYTGKEIRPVVNAVDVDTGETLNGYTVSYADNFACGTGKITVTCTEEGYLLSNGDHTAVHVFTIEKAPLTVTAKDQTIKDGEAIATGVGQVTAEGLLSGHSLQAVSVSAGTGEAADKIIASGAKIIDASNQDVTANYNVTYVPGKLTVRRAISQTVTFRVVNGSWDDGTTADKTVTLTGYEGDTLKLTADQIPAVGTKPADTCKAGSWDTTPSAGTAITEAATYTYTYAQKDSIRQTVTFKVVNGSWDDGTIADKTVTLTGYEGDTLKLSADQIPSVGSKPADTFKAGSWDTTPSAGAAITGARTYTYTYVQKDAIRQTVTFKVVNGSWDDGTTADKTVTLTGYEGDTLMLAADQIPSVGSKPADTYKAGSWDITPSAGAAITEARTYTYTYVQKDAIRQTVTFKVVNGSWDDGTTADKTVTLTGYEGDTLMLAADQIPSVGSKPADTFKAGSWDTTPGTGTAITKATTYTYTYATDAPSESIPQLTEDQKPKAIENLADTGEDQTLVTPPKTLPEGYTGVQYSTDGGQTWADTLPTGNDAGDYEVVTRYIGDGNHEDFTIDPITVSIGDDPLKEYVKRCYRLILGREGEEEGISYWVEELRSQRQYGASMIDWFTKSDEFTARGLSNEDIIDVFYRAMLGREPEEGGYAFWLDALRSGRGTAYLVWGFSASEEFANICRYYGILPGGFPQPDDPDPQPIDPDPQPEPDPVEEYVRRCYELILGREGEEEGVEYWTNLLKTHAAAGADIVSGFVRSDEFIARSLSNDEIVAVFYRTMLGREPEEGGYGFWLEGLEAGYGTDYLVWGFAGSEEFAGICAEYGIIPGDFPMPDFTPTTTETNTLMAQPAEAPEGLAEELMPLPEETTEETALPPQQVSETEESDPQDEQQVTEALPEEELLIEEELPEALLEEEPAA